MVLTPYGSTNRDRLMVDVVEYARGTVYTTNDHEALAYASLPQLAAEYRQNGDAQASHDRAAPALGSRDRDGDGLGRCVWRYARDRVSERQLERRGVGHRLVVARHVGV